MRADPLVEVFDGLAARAPERSLVVSPSQRSNVSAVDSLARAAATRVASVEPGGLVVLRAPNGPGFLASLIALRRRGLAALLIDDRTPQAECARAASTLGAVAMLSCGSAWPRGEDDWRLDRVPGARGDPAHLPDVGVVKLTSGSTGEARGIVTPTEALLADDLALTRTMGIREDDRLLSAVPFSHSYGLSSLVLPALVRGATLVVPDVEGPFSALEAAAACDAVVFLTVPAYLAALLRLRSEIDWPQTLRLIVSAGAPLAPETAGAFRETFGLPVHVFYGASECGGISYDRQGGAAERGTVGSPVEGVRIVLDGSGQGRVTVRSPAVARGYLPETSDRLQKGRFVTDDLAEWRNGELALVGRTGHLINVRGNNVNPHEVERVVRELHGAEDVAVLGVPGTAPAEEIVRAVVACRPGSLTTEAVLSWCRQRLAEYKVPRSVVLVDRLPRTARGKLDRKALLNQGSL